MAQQSGRYMFICVTFPQIDDVLCTSTFFIYGPHVHRSGGDYVIFYGLVMVDDSLNSGIYELMCQICKYSYNGQTSRDLQTRYKEHIRYIKNNNPKSAYAQHISDNQHEFGHIHNHRSELPVSHMLLSGLDIVCVVANFANVKRMLCPCGVCCRISPAPVLYFCRYRFSQYSISFRLL
jgi:hypothetical protein